MSDNIREIYVNGYVIRHIENEAEKLAARALGDALAGREDICICQVCVEDMLLYSLNRLPPQYRHTSTLKLARLRPGISNVEVDKVVHQAIKEVSAHPKHD